MEQRKHKREPDAPELQHAVLDEAHERATQLQESTPSERADQPVTADAAPRKERHAVSLFSELDGGGVRFAAPPPAADEHASEPEQGNTGPGDKPRKSKPR